MNEVKNQFAKWRSVVFAIFIVLVIVGFIAYQFADEEFRLSDFQNATKSFGLWAPIVFVLFYAIGTIFIPSTPFMFLSGLLFGFKEGLLYTVIGGFLSSMIVFEISHQLGKPWVEKILEHQYLQKLDDYNKRLGSGAVWDLIILRILPIMPFNVLNILMGVSRIKTRDYIIGTLVGLAPSNIVSVYFGNLLVKIF